MSFGRLFYQSLRYYWRYHLAIVLGTIVGTTVITGAFLVGDSVRGSLHEMTLARLGDIDYLLQSDRFFREELTAELSQLKEFQQQFERVAPAIVLQGSLETSAKRRANQVTIFGVDQRFFRLRDTSQISIPKDNEIIINARIAQELHLNVGDQLLLWIEDRSLIPRDTLLGHQKNPSIQVPLTVKEIITEENSLSRLAFQPNQQLPLTAFVSLKSLQAQLGVSELKARTKKESSQLAKVNCLVVKAKNSLAAQTEQALNETKQLNLLLAQVTQFEDLSLRLISDHSKKILSLESEDQILSDIFVQAAQSAAQKLNLKQAPVFVYLSNQIRTPKRPQAYSMYSIVAGMKLPKESPFGPFQFIDQLNKETGSDTQDLPKIVFNEWLAQDLSVSPGDQVLLDYYLVDTHNELREKTQTFIVGGVLKLDSTPAADPGLTPTVAGITDTDSFADWEQPFPMQLNRITERDELYWDRYRATPKAFISLSTAQHLWGSRYGKLTSLRLADVDEQSLIKTSKEFSQQFFQQIPWQKIGFFFQPLKFNGLQAAQGTTDFSGLFIGFSSFLILSAMLLICLLLRLSIENRTDQVGLLLALGFRASQVRRLFFCEGLVLLGLGSGMGMLIAILYTKLVIYGLKTWWIGAIGTRFLNFHPTFLSFLMGLIISLGAAMFTLWWSLRILNQRSIKQLLTGDLQDSVRISQNLKNRLRFGVAGSVLVLLLVSLNLLGVISNREAFFGLSWPMILFFIAGMLLLFLCLLFLSVWIDSLRTFMIQPQRYFVLLRLSLNNLRRNRQRSLLSISLIASASFMIVAVAAGRRNPTQEIPQLDSGNGGFLLVAESTTPIVFDLNSPAGREKLNFSAALETEQERLLTSMNVFALRVQPGEEASCLNLYQTQLPTILGVPQRLIDRGGFRFANTSRENPWEVLTENLESQNSIPVIGDLNTLMYSLHKSLNDTIPLPGREEELQVKGMLDGSLLQGVLLMSEENFLKLFPERAGYQFFLIKNPLETKTELINLLENQLADYGFDVESSSARLANFLAVQNTYLSTFQTLGGLGLLLGTIGLAIVMLRNVIERRSELALFRALGFRQSQIAEIVIGENILLLIIGSLVGTLCALLSMTPHLLSMGADFPLTSLGFFLISLVIMGICSSFLAVWEAIRSPILSALRSE